MDFSKPAQDYLDSILQAKEETRIYPISLDDFLALVSKIKAMYGSKSRGRIILNGEIAYAHFPALSDDRLVIQKRFHRPRWFHNLIGASLISANDLVTVKDDVVIDGLLKPTTIWQHFVSEELLRVAMLTLTSTVALVVVTQTLTQQVEPLQPIWNDVTIEPFRAANDVLIQVGAIFFSIFTLFTAAQNLNALSSDQYFRRGLIHKYLQADRLVSAMAVTGLLIAAINRTLSFPLLIGYSTLTVNRVYISMFHILTGLAFGLFVNSLLAVSRYYLDRSHGLHINELTKNSFDKERQQYLDQDTK